MLLSRLCLALLCLSGAFSHDGLPINLKLGVPGHPDCVFPGTPTEDVDYNAMHLVCHQKQRDFDSQIQVGCVGDSITAGVHSSGGNTTYPAQLGILLGNKYKVTNLGACGSTMMKHANSPYWQRPQFKTLIHNKWDIIIIMLGTNDAKDKGHHGPPNWPHDCTGPRALDCPYAKDYASMIKLVRTLGRTPSQPPKIYLAIPPPLMKDGVYGMNATVINDVFPILIPQINSANHVPNKPIDIFDAMGGKDKAHFPPGGCTLENSHVADCRYFCDHQSCDQCHPDDVGYHAMAVAMKKGMGL